MFKFSQLINENVEFEEIEDCLIFIYDNFGEPRVLKSNIDGGMAYNLIWNLNFNLSEYNGVEVLDKTSKLFTSLSELKSTQKRLNQFEIDFKISHKLLYVRFIPKKQSKEAGNYKFIIGQEGREIKLKTSEIIRFYRDNGVKIKNINYEYNESSENCGISISTESNIIANKEFEELFKKELNNSDIDRQIELYYSSNCVNIDPFEEKTYIMLDFDF
jgi:hypothetical protein